MKALNLCYLFVFAAIVSGCSPDRRRDRLEKELIDTDLAFSEMSRREGMTRAFLAYCTEDAVLLREGSMPVTGISAIGEVLSRNDDAAFDLTWEPLFARAANSGDLGYTYGLYTLSMKGTGTSERGTYLSIWSREEGSWKWVLDTGNEGLGE